MRILYGNLKGTRNCNICLRYGTLYIVDVLQPRKICWRRCYGIGSHGVLLPIWLPWYTVVSYLYGTGTYLPTTDHPAVYLKCPGDLTCCNRQCR